eukprot:TRINITY_DN10427_c0_g1_i1.p1 TRINITY_DN10427_c0_g1~~TRINITY_DN10427_c0_g1_i1.p1  ORF type:complete len:403 (-),score=69.35 TRINITY_DN10427_c0_g1_i1:12-1220(-)
MCNVEKCLQVRVLHNCVAKSKASAKAELIQVACRSFPDLLSQLKIRWDKTKLYEFYDINGLCLSSEDFESLNDGELIYASPAHRPFSVLNYLDDYQVLAELGKGGFGTVYQAKHKYSGECRAIKIVKGVQFASVEELSKLFQEVKVMSALNHEGIVKFYGSFSYHARIVIIMEYIHGKTLANWLASHNKKYIPELAAKPLFKQLIEVIAYCHSQKYVHRDLKLDNIMIFEGSRIKLIDFGVARKYNEVSKSGTLIYSPPEIVCNSYLKTDPAIDMWALGIILYKLLLGRFPFEGATQDEIKDQIINRDIDGDEHSEISDECWDVIRSLLKKDRDLRIQLPELLAHPWFHATHIAVEKPKAERKDEAKDNTSDKIKQLLKLSLIHICRCRRYAVCRSRWSPYH